MENLKHASANLISKLVFSKLLMMAEDPDQIEIGDYTISTRPKIKQEDQKRLWVRSGGRCAICNKYLLDLDYDVNVGEMAHIVGWSKGKKSPRGGAALDLTERNTSDNLVLLCADHHKIVDTQALLEEFTIERLILLKTAHENRIYHLTSLQADAETLVLRMLGSIRGAAVEVSKEHARHVVYQGEQKYAMFLDSFDKHGIEIDLVKLPEPEEHWEAYWSIGKSIIDKSLQILEQGMSSGTVRHLSVFALSRIPLLVYLGYKLDDKVPTSVYQKHRGDGETWLWNDQSLVETFEINKLASGATSAIVLIVSVSGTIDKNDLPETQIANTTIYEIKSVGTIPNRNILCNKLSLDNFTQTYQQFLSKLEADHPDCKEIHLFPAIPVAAAIACGRSLMRHAHPSLVIYDRTKTYYKPALSIN